MSIKKFLLNAALGLAITVGSFSNASAYFFLNNTGDPEGGGKKFDVVVDVFLSKTAADAYLIADKVLINGIPALQKKAKDVPLGSVISSEEGGNLFLTLGRAAAGGITKRAAHHELKPGEKSAWNEKDILKDYGSRLGKDKHLFFLVFKKLGDGKFELMYKDYMPVGAAAGFVNGAVKPYVADKYYTGPKLHTKFKQVG